MIKPQSSTNMKIFQTKVWNWGVHLNIGLSISVMQKRSKKKLVLYHLVMNWVYSTKNQHFKTILLFIFLLTRWFDGKMPKTILKDEKMLFQRETSISV